MLYAHALRMSYARVWLMGGHNVDRINAEFGEFRKKEGKDGKWSNF